MRGAFFHGGDVLAASRQLHLRPEEILDFSASINPLDMPPGAAGALKRALRERPAYPEPYAESLLQALAQAHGLKEEHFLAGAGATELIYHVLQCLRPRAVLIPEPAFSEYRRAALLAGARIRSVGGFPFQAERFVQALADVEVAFLCNPHSPAGGVLAPEEVLALALEARRRGALLVLDEAFVDFAPSLSVLDKAPERGFLLLRSMTKFYALASLRVGYLVGPKRLVRFLRRWQRPWALSSPAIAAAREALRDEAFRKKTLAFMALEKAFLERQFQRLGIQFWPSGANFYLLRVRPGAARALLREGILVRDCSNFRRLGAGFVRVAVRRRAENQRLLRGLARWA